MEGATEALDGFAERLFEAGSTELEELLGLADELVRRAEAAREADGIGAVATARNGIGWLSSWGVEGAEV